MDERYLSQAGRVQPSSVAGNRTEYSAVCTGDSLTTLDNGEFSALTIDQGDVEISISIIEVNDADDTSGPTSQAVESIGLEVVEDVLGKRVARSTMAVPGRMCCLWSYWVTKTSSEPMLLKQG